MPSQNIVIDRREYLDKQRRYWETGEKFRLSTSAIADSVLQFLAEKGIEVRDSDWS